MKEKIKPFIEVKAITIVIGSKEIALTLSQAKELRAALNDVFKETVRTEYIRENRYPFGLIGNTTLGPTLGCTSNDLLSAAQPTLASQPKTTIKL